MFLEGIIISFQRNEERYYYHYVGKYYTQINKKWQENSIDHSYRNSKFYFFENIY